MVATSRRGFVRGVLGGAIALEGLGALGHEAAARTFMRGFADGYSAKDADFSAVMVIRQAGISMVANDRLWDEPFLASNNPKDAKYGMIWPDGGRRVAAAGY